MTWLVVGAGAVGTWLAGALAAAGDGVTVVARGEKAAALRAGGLTRVRGETEVRAPVTVAESLDAIAPADYDAALIAVRSYDTGSIAPLLQSARCIVSFQNGVGNEAILATAAPRACVLPATLTTPVRLTAPGAVAGPVSGGAGIARPSGPAADRCAGAHLTLAESLGRGGVATELYRDGRAMKWSKLLLNMTGSGSGALLGWPPDKALAHHDLFEIERAVWRETLAVMDAGAIRVVALPGYAVPRLAWAMRHAPSSAVRSLLTVGARRRRGDKPTGLAADLASGRGRTEIEALHGAVAAEGARMGVATPVTSALARLVDAVAAGRIAWAEFKDRPAALVAAVRGRG